VVGAIIVEDSLLVVADRLSKDIRVFGTHGRLAVRLGREGSGPGEFRILSGIVLEGPKLYAWDLGNRRMTSRTLDGANLETTRVTSPGVFPELVGVLADGSFILRAASYEQSTLSKTGRSREEDSFVHLGPDAELRKTYERPGIDMLFEVRGGRKTGRSLVPTRRTLAAAGGDRIYLLESGAGHLEVVDGRGALLYKGIMPGVVRLVTDDERRALGRVGVPTPPGTLGVASGEVVSLVRDTFPVIDRLLLDSERRLWVRWPVGPFDSIQTWIALDSTFSPHASLALGAEQVLLDAFRGRAVVLTKDSLDVPTVAVWRLGPSDSQPAWVRPAGR
jgi:hypothetical protein